MLRILRPTLHSLNECAQLDASYATQRVWQMHMRVEEGGIHVDFQLVHLPRPISANDAAGEENLLKYWQRGDCMLAARLDDAVVGYLHLIPNPSRQIGILHHLVVDPRHRRQKIGTALIERALQWGREHQLRSFVTSLSTKNHPAISFYMEHGFSFSGFSESFFSAQDITLDFGRVIR